jgi:Flp pilus assembly protein TadB
VSSELFVFTIVFPVVILGIAIFAQLGGSGRLPRNGYVGIRIPSTLTSDEGWRAGHRAATKPAWISFIVSILAAVISWVTIGTASTVFAVIVIVVFAASCVVTVLAASRAARTAVRR